MIITSAALIPLLALVSSAVDISRAYMVKSALQNACDAASLAARRSMRNDTFTTSVDTVAKRFFAFNFPSGSYGTLPFTPAVSRPSTGIIQVTASAQLPTTMMQFFGLQKIPLNVSCNASLNFVNTDVVLVLDTTGSMADPVNGTAKIQTLRSAVLALYDELAPIQQQLEAQGLRLRYGIVPYSSTVNVGRMIYNASPGYLRDSTPYTSRVANYNTPF